MKGRQIIYSVEQMAWLAAKRLMVISDYHQAFCAAFGRTDVSAANLHALRKRKGWRTGRTGCFEKGAVPVNKGKPMPYNPNSAVTRFKAGRLPHNTNYLGHERISQDGYVEISVDQRNPHTGFERRYVLKHRHLRESANGPIPEGMMLKCLDSDKLNTDPSNWALLPRAILPRLNGGRHKTAVAYDHAPAELKPAILATAQLAHQARVARQAKARPKGQD